MSAFDAHAHFDDSPRYLTPCGLEQNRSHASVSNGSVGGQKPMSPASLIALLQVVFMNRGLVYAIRGLRKQCAAH